MKKIYALLLSSLLLAGCATPLNSTIQSNLWTEAQNYCRSKGFTIRESKIEPPSYKFTDMGAGAAMIRESGVYQLNTQPDFFGSINFKCERKVTLFVYSPNPAGKLVGAIAITLRGNKQFEGYKYQGMETPQKPKIIYDWTTDKIRFDLKSFTTIEKDNVEEVNFFYNTYLGKWFR